MMVNQRIDDAEHALRTTATDATVVGLVFVVLGCGFIAVLPHGAPAWRIMVAGFAGVVLVAPGAWHITSSVFLRRKQAWVVGVSLRVSAAQVVLIAIGIPLMFIGRDAANIFAPAAIAVFFIPALVALLVRLVHTRRAINLMGMSTRGFEISPQRVIPVDAPSDYLSESDRPK